MNTGLADPDIKINMSLDEIIKLTKGDMNNDMQGKNMGHIKKKRKNQKRMGSDWSKDHSVPLLSSSQGVGIYVSKKSPLLSAENKRRIAQFVSNRVLNSELLEKSKEIIPAEYKLVKTANGVERVLVPAANYLMNPMVNTSLSRNPSREYPSSSSSDLCSESHDRPPPLVAVPIYKTPEQPPLDSMAMGVVNPEDDVVVLNSKSSNKHSLEVIDVESNLPVDVLETKKLFMPGVNVMPRSGGKTLNDRFTMLTGNFQF